MALRSTWGGFVRTRKLRGDSKTECCERRRLLFQWHKPSRLLVGLGLRMKSPLASGGECRLCPRERPGRDPIHHFSLFLHLRKVAVERSYDKRRQRMATPINSH